VQHQQIKTITVVPASRKCSPAGPHPRALLTLNFLFCILFQSSADCAFIVFTTRSMAERVAESLSAQGSVEVLGKRAKIVWGRSRPQKGAAKGASGADKGVIV
jgi:hypothetical protein